MATYNFGMLTAGMPDATMRQTSTTVGPTPPPAAPTPINFLDLLGAEQRKSYSALQDQFNGYMNQVPNIFTANDGAYFNSYFNGQSSSVPAWVTRDVSPGTAAWGASGGPFANEMMHLQGQMSAIASSAQAQADAQNKAAQSAYEQAKATGGPTTATQKALQDAYNQTGGGSYLGGNINSSYATPQTGLDPNSALNGMLSTQPWSMPGFGGPTGGTSQSGFGTNTGNAWGNSQPSGWGGPFTAKNPWAAS